jgi:hypothetical protein
MPAATISAVSPARTTVCRAMRRRNVIRSIICLDPVLPTLSIPAGIGAPDGAIVRHDAKSMPGGLIMEFQGLEERGERPRRESVKSTDG